MLKWNKAVRVTFLTAILGGLMFSLLLMRGIENRVMAEADPYEDLKIFTEALSALQQNYVEPVKTKDLSYGAIKGMLNSLDAHSGFMAPEIYKEMQIDTKGEFGGVGIQIVVKEGRLVVSAPIEGTPADKAGILAGDVILKVDQHAFSKDVNMMDAVNKMRGARGTKVALTILRKGFSEPKVFELTREIIHIKSVKSNLLEPGVGYIRLTQFQEQTASDMVKALATLKEEKIHSLVLDLRNNPGGLLTSAVDVSEAFLDAGKVVVSVRGRDAKKGDEYRADGSGSAMADLMIIVLVNEGSASASEIVAGALQDWGRAVVLGTQTFGKGSVQTILPLSDGSALRLTTARYYTPNGRSIQNTGVTPDIVVKQADAKESRVALREKDLERHMKNDTNPAADTPTDDVKKTPPEGDPAPAPDNETPAAPPSADATPDSSADVQLQKAVDLLKSWKIFKNLSPLQTTAQAADRVE